MMKELQLFFWKGLQDAITIVKIINLCRLITVPENKTFLCTVYFALLQKFIFNVKFYLPEMPFTVLIW